MMLRLRFSDACWQTVIEVCVSCLGIKSLPFERTHHAIAAALLAIVNDKEIPYECMRIADAQAHCVAFSNSLKGVKWQH